MGRILVKAIQQEVGNIDGKGTKGKAYVIHPDRYNTINSSDIIDMCAESSHVPRAYISASMIAISECIRNYLLDGHTVEFPDLGFFSLTSKSEIETDVDKVGIHQVKQFNIRFRPCEDLKREVKEVEVVLEGIFDIAGTDAKGRKYYTRVQRRRRSKK